MEEGMGNEREAEMSMTGGRGGRGREAGRNLTAQVPPALQELGNVTKAPRRHAEAQRELCPGNGLMHLHPSSARSLGSTCAAILSLGATVEQNSEMVSVVK